MYLPTGNAVPDYYGAKRRPFDEKYSSSVVALDIETGAPKWSFQTLHHDLWDMDVPIGPTLVDLQDTNGKNVPALVQTTKRGELFVLNRETGEPVAQVAEKPAPQGGLPGEPVSATQPYSVGMPSFAPPQIEEKDAWGVTPIDQMLCRIEFRSLDYKGAFTPFSLDKKTLVYPAFDGVIDWHGASVDPERKRLYANLSYIPFVAQTLERSDAEKKVWSSHGMARDSRQDLRSSPSILNTARLMWSRSILGLGCWAHLAKRHRGGSWQRLICALVPSSGNMM